MKKTPPTRIPWPPLYYRGGGETNWLAQLVEKQRWFLWTGWRQVAEELNRGYGNRRTPEACRRKYARLRADRG
jgi:hypothetical protein